MSVFVGGMAGAIAGTVLLVLSHLAPKLGANVYVRDLDQVCILGHDCSHREAHAIGILLHLLLSLLFGALYALGMQEGFLALQPLTLALYALALTVFVGGVVMPLEGHGFFGVKEDTWFTADLLITNVLWVALFGLFFSLLA